MGRPFPTPQGDYAVFGAGFWDLIAGGAERGERPRGLIQNVLTPVWEANHVWLIFCLVVLWTGFPEAFGALMSTLYVPLSLAALGIVLRGAGFAIRTSIRSLQARRAMGAVFALAGIFALHSEARYVYDGLTGDGLPLVIASGLCGLGVLALLARGVEADVDEHTDAGADWAIPTVEDGFPA